MTHNKSIINPHTATHRRFIWINYHKFCLQSKLWFRLCRLCICVTVVRFYDIRLESNNNHMGAHTHRIRTWHTKRFLSRDLLTFTFLFLFYLSIFLLLLMLSVVLSSSLTSGTTVTPVVSFYAAASPSPYLSHLLFIKFTLPLHTSLSPFDVFQTKSFV